MPLNLEEFSKGKKIVVFAVPAAFSPTCSQTHLPGYIENHDKLKERGIDEIICVLDEVDAPLDDANVERFCNLLDDISAKTQTKFMIITHHALTMSRMDRLFGVTMAERGVSQIVSVDLKRAEEIGAVA